MPDLPRGRRPQRPSWIQPIAARLTPAVKALVVVNALLFFFFLFVQAARAPMIAHLALGPGFLRGELWQPVTALFFNFKPLDFIFDIIGLWFVGGSLESIQGTKRFVFLFLAGGVLANLAIGLVQFVSPIAPFAGCSLAVLAALVALGRIYGREQLRLFGSFTLQARVLALAFVVWGVVASLWPPPSWPLLAGTLVATAVGYLAAAPRGLRELYDIVRARRLRRRYRVLEGGASRRGRTPKYWN
jgi:membrane associated rhomboid family serine protease